MAHKTWTTQRFAETTSSIRNGAKLLGVKGVGWLPDGLLQDALALIVSKIDEKPTVDLTDIPANGEVLTYDSASGKYKPSASGGAAVSSVFTRTGAVVAASGDYNAGQITNTPAGNIAATTVQAAINELDSEKLSSVSASGVSNTPAGNIAATTVQAAINELDSEKATPSQIPAVSSQAQADTGTDDTTFMSPLKVASRPQRNVVFETFIEGLALEWVSTTSVKVKAGAAWVPGVSKIVNLAADVTLVNTTDYTLAASKWYYVYLTDTGTISVVRDDGTNPTPALYKGTARQQTSNSNRRYVGAFKSSASSTVLKFRDTPNGLRTWLENTAAAPLAIINSATTSATLQSCSACVPVSSRTVLINAYMSLTTNHGYLGNGDILGTFSTSNATTIVLAGAGACMFLETDSSQQIWFICSAGGGAMNASVLGYVEER